MSVQVSYRKQVIFGILFLIIIYFGSEVVIQTYNYYFPNCNFMNSEVFDDVDKDLQRQICFDTDKIKSQNTPLRNIPNQELNTININSEGFRGGEFSELKEENTYRIFVVGGSTILGNSATSDDTTIPGWLQNYFNRSDNSQNIQVINAGIGGSFSFTEMNFIKNELINYEPDLFVIYGGWNDIVRPRSVQNEDSGDYNLATQILRNFVVKNDFIQIPGLLFKHYNFYKFSTMDVYKVFDDDGMNEKTQLWGERWTEICKLGSEKDFDVIIALQPLVGTGNKILTDEEIIYFKKYDHEHLIPNYERYGIELESLDKVCTESIDLRNVFDDEIRTMFHDSGHVGDEGNKIIAKKIFDIISPKIQK